MHQLAPQVSFASIQNQPVRKETLEDHDLQVVANLICDGLRQGFYTDILQVGTRSEVLGFVRGVAASCEYRQYDPVAKRARTRVAALLVYTVKGTVVGFAVLAEAVSESMKRGIELIMLGVVTRHRGLGYGASILDGLIKTLSRQFFTLIVRCSGDNQLLLAMLLTRGFHTVGHFCRGRILSLAPSFNLSHFREVPSFCADDKQAGKKPKAKTRIAIRTPIHS